MRVGLWNEIEQRKVRIGEFAKTAAALRKALQVDIRALYPNTSDR